MSDEERFEKALNDYREKFGKNYPLVITSLASTEDVIADIEKCIRKGKSKPEPKFRENEVL